MTPLAALLLLGPVSPLSLAQSVSKAGARALVAKDVASIEARLAPDYVFTTLKGTKQNKAQAVQGMKGAFASIKGTPKVTTKVVSARMDGAGLVYVEEQTVVARVGDGPKLTTIESTMRTESLCVKKGAVWQTKRTKVLRDGTKIDGKVVQAY